jgi:hypothetical protein
MKIIIDYLMKTDYDQPAYKAVLKYIEKFQIIKCENLYDIENAIRNIIPCNEDAIITFLSHGHERGLAKETWDSLVTWCELLALVNNNLGNYKLVLNLIAVCNSNRISTVANFCNHQIDEIWVTTSDVVSINKSLLALNASSFDDFNEQLEDDEKVLYENIVL